MSSTNKTTNYELSQFLGTDKPAWLNDYNQDMSKIDNQMKVNADANTVTDGKADSNTSKIGTLSNLTTTAKTDLVSSINEVNTTAGTASGTATAAASAANAAKSESDALTSYLSINQNAKITPTISGGTVSNINDLYYALNAAGTLGKIYGRYRFTVNTTGTITLTLPIPALTPSSQFTISSACYFNNIDNGVFSVINAKDMVVNTNGNCVITFNNLTVGTTVTIWLPPCLYFFTDFGDVINPEN
jgi:hypothetical protein